MDYDVIVKDYLSRRKISPAVQIDFGVHAGMTPSMGECIVIPIVTGEGEFSFNKYRRSPLKDGVSGPKYIYDKGGTVQLYGAWKAKNESKVLWCEGEFDALVAWSANIPAVSSTGGALSIDMGWKPFFESKDVTICFDNDKAGGEGAAKALALVPNARVLFLPKEVKDIGDYVVRGGDLDSVIGTAKAFPTYESVVADRAEKLATWQPVYFHEAYIEAHRERNMVERHGKVKREAGDDVGRAKEFPIPEMIKFDFNRSAKCLWHAENTPSLHYYPQDNHLYCFGGCGRGYDAIDVYMKIHSVGFREAVKKLQ